MRQQSLASSGFERFRKKAKKEVFLDKLDHLVSLGRVYRGHCELSFVRIFLGNDAVAPF